MGLKKWRILIVCLFCATRNTEVAVVFTCKPKTIKLEFEIVNFIIKILSFVGP